MKFTKREILTAIKYEPLSGGNGWISSLRSGGLSLAKKNCTVCLVGGVLRRKVARKRGLTVHALRESIRAFFGIGEMRDPEGRLSLTPRKNGGELVDSSSGLKQARKTAKSLIKDGHYLAALSRLFETHADHADYITPAVRKALAADVRKMFPNSFEEDLEVNAALGTDNQEAA